MATLIKKTNKKGGKRFEIQFYWDGRRRTVVLGSRYSERQAGLVKCQVERLIDCAATNRDPDQALEAWSETLDDALREKLVALGLLAQNERLTLGEVWERFVDSQRFARFADNTARNYLAVRKRFFEFFDERDPTDVVTKVDAAEQRESMIAEGFAEATVAGAVKCVRTVFRWAVDATLIESHPFDAIPRGSFENKSREFFIPLDWYARLLDRRPERAPNAFDFAYCRIGGLRCPSETSAARWEDVDWERGTLLVRDSKRKRTRLIPLFPELRQELDKQFFETQGDPSPYVIARRRGPSANLRTSFARIVFWAGLPQWERLFHNLRGSRSCELFSAYPAHVASAWMGHAEKVANAHYLHPTDDDFARANGRAADRASGAGTIPQNAPAVAGFTPAKTPATS